MENSWRNHDAKLLYACYGKSLGMVFDSEHTMFSHQSSNRHCMLLSTYYPVVKHTEFSQQDKALGANLRGSKRTLLEQSKIHTQVFFWWYSEPYQNDSNREPKDMKIFHETCSWEWGFCRLLHGTVRSTYMWALTYDSSNLTGYVKLLL